MTDLTSTVLAGQAVNIAAMLPSGFTIRNQSTTTAVWVSGSAGVTPGNGMKISALGSLEWTGGPCYACLDSTTGQATLSLSSTATNVTDPVAVAEAVNQLGVPSVLIGGTINGTLNGPLIDVSTYASVAGLLHISGACVVTITFWDTSGTIPLYEKKYTFSAACDSFQFSSPVYGPQLQITTTGGTTGDNNFTLYGSNRQLPERCYSDGGFYRTLNETYPSGTVLLGAALLTNGGEAFLNIRCTSGPHTTGFLFGFQYWDLTNGAPGALQSLWIVTSSELSVDTSNNYNFEKQFNIPAGLIQPMVLTFGSFTGTITVSGTLP